jgi:hypothetical protein
MTDSGGGLWCDVSMFRIKAPPSEEQKTGKELEEQKRMELGTGDGSVR